MFAVILKKLRLAKNLSQGELAKAIGVSKSSIGMYEQGCRIPKADATLQRIASYFDVSVDYLLGLDSTSSFDLQLFSKKNDALADIILKARRDEDLIELIKELCDLSPEHRQSVKAFLAVLKQQNVNNVE